MALNLDGMGVLRAIAENRSVFSGISADATKYARTLVMKQLKAKNSGLSTMRDVRSALGREAISHILDVMTDTEVKSLVGRLDKYHPELKASNAAWRRAHLRSLAEGKAEPAEKPARAVKAKAAAKPRARKTPAKREFLDLQSMKVTRRRRS